jgi:hypothetical protein
MKIRIAGSHLLTYWQTDGQADMSKLIDPVFGNFYCELVKSKRPNSKAFLKFQLINIFKDNRLVLYTQSRC